jgi:hypothetical protein
MFSGNGQRMRLQSPKKNAHPRKQCGGKTLNIERLAHVIGITYILFSFFNHILTTMSFAGLLPLNLAMRRRYVIPDTTLESFPHRDLTHSTD